MARWSRSSGPRPISSATTSRSTGNACALRKSWSTSPMNKPKNCVTTVSDPEGRATVMDLLRGVKERVYPVGRLDYHSEGLLLLTNDGEFAKRITAAGTHVAKTYVVKVNGPLTPEQEEKFRARRSAGR